MRQLPTSPLKTRLSNAQTEYAAIQLAPPARDLVKRSPIQCGRRTSERPVRPPGRRWRGIRVLKCIVLTLTLCQGVQSRLCAEDQTISQMVHTSWTVRDGAPQNINTLAQTADGTLWLGTRDGLYNFDGLKFSVSNLVPRKNVYRLYATRDGALWVTWGNGPATRIRGGLAEVIDRVDGDAMQRISYLAEDSDKTIWAVLNGKTLVRLGGDGVWHIAKGPKAVCDNIGPLFIDSAGTLWAIADGMLYRRPRGDANFNSTRVPVAGGFKMAEGLDHSVWVVGVDRPIHVDQFGRILDDFRKLGDVSEMEPAEDGSVWLSHVDAGVQRLRGDEIHVGHFSHSGKNAKDVYGVPDGLLTTGYRVLLRDRDGNMWVAGGRGLDEFQTATMVPIIRNAMNGGWSFCSSPNGDIWVALFDRFLGVLRAGRLNKVGNTRFVRWIRCDRDGRVWTAVGANDLAEIRGSSLHFLPRLPVPGAPLGQYRVSGLAAAPDNQLLISTVGSGENGLWIYRKRLWQRFLPDAGFNLTTSMLGNAHANIYLGSIKGKITLLNAKTYQTVSSTSTSIGVISGFSETSYGVFAFGENGIALNENRTFRVLPFADSGLAISLTGLAEDRNHDIWINGSRAIIQVPAAEIHTVLSNPLHPLLAREFREGEFRGSDAFTYSRNSVQIDNQGRILFATANGIIYIDPQHLGRRSRLPTLSIKSVVADGKLLNAKGIMAPGTQTLNVQYFGLNLSNPSAVVYRYRLVGYDPEWQDVGGRAEAIYTHLRPGRYTFQVIAGNGDGTWTEPVSTSPFTALPAFYQTWWFETLCALTVVLVLWLGLTMRVRYYVAQVKIEAEARADERIRIARELHDTLLQGVQGLLLSFHVAAGKVPADHESKAALEKALTSADRIILEGRNRVTRLRSENLSDAELKPSIEGIAADLNETGRVNVAVERKGGSDSLQGHIVDEVFYITREALTNAFRHSEASRVVVELDYQKREFSMTCRDNGRGFDKDELRGNHTNGHWGLRGMAERAGRIGAHFCYASAVDKGTEVQVTIPARRAYVRHGRLRQSLREGASHSNPQ
jgi:signal transduction histidine kinase